VTTRRAPREPAWSEGVRVVLARELSAWFDSPIAYVAIVAGLLATGSMFMNEFFLAGKLDMTPFFERLPWVLVLLLPAISMRLWSEDLRVRTFELWMTLPLEPAQVVLGKYLAALSVYAVFLAGTLPIVLVLCILGRPDLGAIASGYLGAALLGALFLAAGMLLSGLTADQIVAFLSAALAGLVLVSTGEERVVAVLDGLAPRLAPGTLIADHLSALPHYETFVRGVIGLSSLAYFAGLSALLLLWNAIIVGKRRS